ncbi:hypothetical protein ACYF6T_18495 [Streptomyces sp. 7R007]
MDHISPIPSERPSPSCPPLAGGPVAGAGAGAVALLTGSRFAKKPKTKAFLGRLGTRWLLFPFDGVSAVALNAAPDGAKGVLAGGSDEPVRENTLVLFENERAMRTPLGSRSAGTTREALALKWAAPVRSRGQGSRNPVAWSVHLPLACRS